MLFKDSGWEHICGNRSCGAQYFKRIDESSDSDIFSDLSSKAGRYKRLSNVWMSLAGYYSKIKCEKYYRKSGTFYQELSSN
jgi:hypothetical protein